MKFCYVYKKYLKISKIIRLNKKKFQETKIHIFILSKECMISTLKNIIVFLISWRRLNG